MKKKNVYSTSKNKNKKHLNIFSYKLNHISNENQILLKSNSKFVKGKLIRII